VVIPKGERDPSFPEKLRAELPGILRWMVEGHAEYLRRGLDPPEEVRASTAEYRADQDVIRSFVRDCGGGSESASGAVMSLYVEYKQWCERAGERALKAREFKARLVERGLPEPKKSTRGRYIWRGIGLLADEGEDRPPSGQVDLSGPSDNNFPHEAHIEKKHAKRSTEVHSSTLSEDKPPPQLIDIEDHKGPLPSEGLL
jgi:putative DNA primase/helicase